MSASPGSTAARRREAEGANGLGWRAHESAIRQSRETDATAQVHDVDFQSARLLKLRRACLRAVARVHGHPEPSAETCDRAKWHESLEGAWRSIVRESGEGARAAPAEVTPPYRPPYAWTLPVAAAALLIALLLAPPTAFWDTKSHLPSAQPLGIPNAPTSWLFVVFVRAWVMLLGPLTPSTEILLTLFPLLVGAALATLTFLVAHRVLSGFPGGSELRVHFAVGVSLLSAGMIAVLGSDVAHRGAFLLNVTVLSGAAWLAWRWRERRLAPRTS